MTSTKVKPLCRTAFRMAFSLGVTAHKVQWSRELLGKFDARENTVSKSERQKG